MVFIYRIRYCAKQVVAPSFISQSEEIPYCRESDSALKLCVKSEKIFSLFWMRAELWNYTKQRLDRFGKGPGGNWDVWKIRYVKVN